MFSLKRETIGCFGVAVLPGMVFIGVGTFFAQATAAAVRARWQDEARRRLGSPRRQGRGGDARQSVATGFVSRHHPPKPRGGPSALAGGEEQTGQARRPGSPHTLSWRGKSSANCAMVLLALPPPDHL